MSWFSEKRIVATKHNGTMELNRFMGKWSLWAKDRTQESGPYIDAMWRNVFVEVKKRKVNVQRCLVLGVCLGGVFPLLHKAFPQARVLAIDWDSELFLLGRDLGVWKSEAYLECLVGDVATLVPHLEGFFDLVVIDLFTGHDVAPVVFNSMFQNILKQKLNDNAIVCVNAYEQPEVFGGWKTLFHEQKIMHYGTNDIGLFVAGAV